MEDLEEDPHRLGVRQWRRLAQNSDKWRGVVLEAELYKGCRLVRGLSSSITKSRPESIV